MSQPIVGINEFNRESANLEGLAADGFHNSNLSTYMREPRSVLQTNPSFSIYNSRDDEEEGGLERSVTIMSDFSFSNEKGISLVEVAEETEENSGIFDGAKETPSMYLAMGLGIDLCDQTSAVIGDGGDSARELLHGSDVENYYKRMIEENPRNPLFLRNYAQFLYQSKGDFEGAEVYYSRALLVEPGDGEILSQYAKLIWEQHHDPNRASGYFQQAVQAAPEDSDVLAAYASFLWEAEEEEGEEDDGQSQDFAGAPIPHGTNAPARASKALMDPHM